MLRIQNDQLTSILTNRVQMPSGLFKEFYQRSFKNYLKKGKKKKVPLQSTVTTSKHEAGYKNHYMIESTK